MNIIAAPENRIVRLSTTIRTSVEEMLSEKMASQFRKRKISTATFSKSLFEILDVALKCEREQYIKEQEAEIARLKKENYELQRNLQDERRKFAHENSLISTDNADLLKRYESLDGQYKALGWKKEQKDLTYQEQLQQKDRYINQLRAALRSSQSNNRQMIIELRNIHEFITNSTRKNARALKTMKKIISERMGITITRAVTKQKKKDEKYISTLSTQYKTEKMSHDQLKGASQLLLDSVWNISPKGKTMPKVPIDDLPRRISEVHSFISNSIEDQKLLAVDEVKKELSHSLPEISMVEENVSQAVSTVVTERIAEKEAEFQLQLQQSQKRENKLRKRLEKALSQIHKIQQQKVMSPKPTSLDFLEDVDELKDDWELRKRQLDMKMSELEKGMSSFSQSPISKPKSPHFSTPM